MPIIEIKMKTQVFKGRKLALGNVAKNILNVYNRAGEIFRNQWYAEANQYAVNLSSYHNIPVSISCGIIAALSPMKTWDDNKKIAALFLRTGYAKHTNLFAGKAREILNSNGSTNEIESILKGRKITSFFYNILNPGNNENVTIDRHALSIALGYSVIENEYRGMTAKQYAFFTRAYKQAANEIAISPVLLQSTTWQQWRKEKGIASNEGIINDENISEEITAPF